MTSHKSTTSRTDIQQVRILRSRLAELNEAEKEVDRLRDLVSLIATENMMLRNALGEKQRERDQAVTCVFRLLMAGADATVLDGS